VKSIVRNKVTSVVRTTPVFSPAVRFVRLAPVDVVPVFVSVVVGAGGGAGGGDGGHDELRGGVGGRYATTDQPRSPNSSCRLRRHSCEHEPQQFESPGTRVVFELLVLRQLLSGPCWRSRRQQPPSATTPKPTERRKLDRTLCAHPHQRRLRDLRVRHCDAAVRPDEVGRPGLRRLTQAADPSRLTPAA